MSTSEAREAILTRVRSALADVPAVPAEQDTPVPWAYGQPRALDDVIDQFEDRVVDYRAGFERCSAADLPGREQVRDQLFNRKINTAADNLLADLRANAVIRRP